MDPRIAWVSITDVVDDPGAKIRLGPRGTNSGSYPEIETDLIAAVVNAEARITGSANASRSRRQIVPSPR